MYTVIYIVVYIAPLGPTPTMYMVSMVSGSPHL